MPEIPPAKNTDAEDVVWGLQTAETLWKRGERIDALVWLRRAAQAAGDASDDDRAVELARYAAQLTDWMASTEASLPNASSPNAPAPESEEGMPIEVEEEVSPVLGGPWAAAQSAPPPRAPSQPLSEDTPARGPQGSAPAQDEGRPSATSVPPAEKVHAGMFDPWADQSAQMAPPPPPPTPPPPAPPKPPPAPPKPPPVPAKPPPVPPKAPAAKPPPPPIPPVTTAATFEDEEVVTSVRPASIVPKSEAPPVPRSLTTPPSSMSPPARPSRPNLNKPPSPPKPPPLPPRARSIPKPSVPPISVSEVVPAEPSTPPAPVLETEPPVAVLETEPPVAVLETEPPLEVHPTTPPPVAAVQATPPSIETTAESVIEATEAPEEAPAPEVVEAEAPMETAPAPEVLEVHASPEEAVPERAPEHEVAVPDIEAYVPPPEAIRSSHPASAASETKGLVLDTVEAFADLPDDARTAFAEAATLHPLAEGEEIGTFALAYIVAGSFDVAATVVDAPAVRLAEGAVLRARGTTDEGVPMRLICANREGVVATWSDAAVEEAFRTIPWVEDDLRAAADKVQTLVGITIGPLGERLDVSIREEIVSRLTMRPLGPSEIIVQAGDPVPGLLLVGIGALELVKDDTVAGIVGSGEFLFPTEVLGAGSAPLTARAGAGGALVMFGDRRIAQELLVTCPPLLEVFAGM